MQHYIERIWWDGLLHISGWIFDAEREISKIECVITNRYYVDTQTANWGFVRNDVVEGTGQVAAAKSGFHVFGLVVSAESQLDLKVFYADGELVEHPLALVNLPGATGPQSTVPKIFPLSDRVCTFADGHPPALEPKPLEAILENFRKPASHLATNTRESHEPINVFVCAYKGLEYLDPLFDSLFKYADIPFDLTIVDNGNDDPAVTALLSKVAETHSATTRLVRLEQNVGYIGGMNAAFQAAPPNRHVVVLNTDLVLPPRWLSRLVRPILERNDIATVTPFTNAGTSCSFPIVGDDNAIFHDLTVENIDHVFQLVEWSRGGISLPSGVGFCMAHNKAVIQRIGWYDVESFGLGYGEENDWCLKARRMGYRNVLTPNMFVWHKHGGVYPSEQKRALIEKNARIIAERYPEYSELVKSYFESDPAGALRTIIGAMLISRAGAVRCAAIYCDVTGQAAQEGVDHKIEVTQSGGLCVWIAQAGKRAVRVSLVFRELSTTFSTDSAATLKSLLDLLNIKTIIVMSSFPNRVVGEVLDLLKPTRRELEVDTKQVPLGNNRPRALKKLSNSNITGVL